MALKLEDLEETRSFYNWKLKDKGLTEKQRDSFLLALKSIERINEGKRKSIKNLLPVIIPKRKGIFKIMWYFIIVVAVVLGIIIYSIKKEKRGGK